MLYLGNKVIIYGTNHCLRFASFGALIHEWFNTFNSRWGQILSHIYVNYSVKKGFYYYNYLLSRWKRVITLKCHLDATLTKLYTIFVTTALLRFFRALSSIQHLLRIFTTPLLLIVNFRSPYLPPFLDPNLANLRQWFVPQMITLLPK